MKKLTLPDVCFSFANLKRTTIYLSCFYNLNVWNILSSPHSSIETFKKCRFAKVSLHHEDKTDVGIVNSPYSSSYGVYECFCAKVTRRNELTDDSSRYFYGFSARLMRIPGKQSSNLENGIFTRKHHRKTYLKPVNFTGNNHFYIGLIKDISRTEILIETKDKFTSGQTLTLAIPFSKKKKRVIVKE